MELKQNKDRSEITCRASADDGSGDYGSVVMVIKMIIYTLRQPYLFPCALDHRKNHCPTALSDQPMYRLRYYIFS